ncbi:MAG: hypothetical protein GF399_03925 [Candidatus Coatesbacteria bacterium]|nr:hypothetical protein [Candidatus Coatesbacteria bacterium]
MTQKTKLWLLGSVFLALIGVLLLLVFHWRATALEAQARNGALVVDALRAKSRLTTVIDNIMNLQVDNIELRRSLNKRRAEIERLVQVEVGTVPMSYTAVPAEPEGETEPPAAFSGSWTAAGDHWRARFSYPPPTFDIELLRRHAELEIVWDDQDIVGVATEADWLIIDDVHGLRRRQPDSDWSLGATLRYPETAVGAHLDWKWLTFGVDYSFDEQKPVLRMGVEFDL